VLHTSQYVISQVLIIRTSKAIKSTSRTRSEQPNLLKYTNKSGSNWRFYDPSRLQWRLKPYVRPISVKLWELTVTWYMDFQNYLGYWCPQVSRETNGDCRNSISTECVPFLTPKAWN